MPKYAKLDYEVLAYNNVKDLSLLKINLHTGRHHQIRVQLSNFGHSIFGDQKYGTRGKGKQIALWAYNLTIEHPITKEQMVFQRFARTNWDMVYFKRSRFKSVILNLLLLRILL